MLEFLSKHEDKAYNLMEIAVAVRIIEQPRVRDLLDLYDVLRVRETLETLMAEKKVEAREFTARKRKMVFFRASPAH